MSDLVGTVAQVARRLECSESKVRELIRTGRMPFIRLGDQKIVVPWRALEQWLETETSVEFETSEKEVAG
jgi:excisionase family DNA binding protein